MPLSCKSNEQIGRRNLQTIYLIKNLPPKYISNSYCEVLKVKNGQGFEKIFLSREHMAKCVLNKRKSRSVGKDREKAKPCHTVFRNPKWCSKLYGKIQQRLLKILLIELPYDGASLLLSLYPKALKPGVCILVFNSVLSIFTKWKWCQ